MSNQKGDEHFYQRYIAERIDSVALCGNFTSFHQDSGNIVEYSGRYSDDGLTRLSFKVELLFQLFCGSLGIPSERTKNYLVSTVHCCMRRHKAESIGNLASPVINDVR